MLFCLLPERGGGGVSENQKNPYRKGQDFLGILFERGEGGLTQSKRVLPEK